MGRKKNKKRNQSKKKKKKEKRTRHRLFQATRVNEPAIRNLVTGNERGARSQFTDSMTADDLLKHYAEILKGYSPPMGNNAQTNFALGSAAIDLAQQRRDNNPETKPKSKKMRRDPTPSSGARFKRTLSFDGGRKSKRRRKKKRRRTIKKKRKKREKKN